MVYKKLNANHIIKTYIIKVFKLIINQKIEELLN